MKISLIFLATCIGSPPTNLSSYYLGHEMKNTLNGIISRSMTIEEKIRKFYAIATETRNKSQKETQKDKRTGKK